MNDMFGRKINVDDIVTYAVKSSRGVNMRIAKVIEDRDDSVQVNVLAGNESRWQTGECHFDWRGAGDTTWELLEGYKTTLHNSRHVLIINGFDAEALHQSLLRQQRLHIEEDAARTAARR